jgi:hypothetical protein
MNLITYYKKKSLKERFLLFIGILFFLIYLTLGVLFLFWESSPFNLQPKYRIAFGVILIVYAITRLLRFYNSNKEDEK